MNFIHHLGAQRHVLLVAHDSLILAPQLVALLHLVARAAARAGPADLVVHCGVERNGKTRKTKAKLEKEQISRGFSEKQAHSILCMKMRLENLDQSWTTKRSRLDVA